MNRLMQSLFVVVVLVGSGTVGAVDSVQLHAFQFPERRTSS